MGIFLGSLLYNIGLGVFLCGSIVRFCLKLGIVLSLAFSFCFDHLGSSCFYVNFLIGYSSSVMTTIGIFMERPCNLWIFLNNRNKYCKNSHFTVLIISMHKNGRSSHFFLVSSSLSFLNILKFSL